MCLFRELMPIVKIENSIFVDSRITVSNNIFHPIDTEADEKWSEKNTTETKPNCARPRETGNRAEKKKNRIDRHFCMMID